MSLYHSQFGDTFKVTADNQGLLKLKWLPSVLDKWRDNWRKW